MPEVLVVEDETPQLRGLVEVLEREGFQPRTAQSLESARAALAESVPSLLLLDLGLPDGNGLDLLGDLNDVRPEVVLITGQATVDTAVVALRAGVRDVLVKPVDVRRLRTILTEVATGTEERARTRQRFGDLVGGSPPMQAVYAMIARVAPTEAPVLVTGESGTGKELLARTIHERSPRRLGPFVALNCGAVAPTLIESELFGHERGSFTGAVRRHTGHFERASAGTLFLDEITEMPGELQTKLLRALESQTVLRVGGEEPIPVDVRVVAATNRAPTQAVREGRLREDLYYRLNVFPITLPALRERPGDVVLLARYFLQQLGPGRQRKRLSESAMRALETYAWPGNVRQLRNVIERAFIVAGDEIDALDLPEDLLDVPRGDPRRALTVGASLWDMQRRLILETLEHFKGDKPRTAKVLGVSLKTLYNRLHAYHYKLRQCRRR